MKTNLFYRLLPGVRSGLITCLLLLAIASVRAGEGMWLPLLLKALNEAEMKSMGMKMSAEDIYSVNRGSLKDAVVHFGGFCTGEVISGQGLLLTNHHCGYGAIQEHSTLEQNYLRDGFWAKTHAEEIPTPDLFATFIVRMEDVTAGMLEGITAEMDGKERQRQLELNMQTVRAAAARESYQDVMIRSFFEGNQYYLFVTETYNDVRYVGSPPESIGKFGADTDNWVWPRHTGDFALFRIYAGPDNKPAAYSPDNKPFQPRHFFPISLDGIDEGDFTLVFGFPGRTFQYLPSFAVAQTAEQIDPARVGVRDVSLRIWDKYMRADEATRLAYASKYAGLSNGWKKWIGEMQGLKSKNAVGVKEEQEAAFTALLQQRPELQAKYGELLPTMKQLYAELDPVIHDRTILAEILGGSNIEIFRLAANADRLVRAYREGGDAGFATTAERFSDAVPAFYAEYRPAIDQEVLTALLIHASEKLKETHQSPVLLELNPGTASAMVDEIFRQSYLPLPSALSQLIQQGGAAFVQGMEADKAYQLYLELKKPLDESLSPAYTSLNNRLQELQRSYVTALMEAYPDRRFWPDANSTLRVTYGQVEPYEPRDGVQYKTQTYLEGIMEKYVPGDYEFDVHPRLQELYRDKDYGPYADDGKLPVCFIASNHTTGGNSGSPAIDAYGNLIGINFDRVWEGTMSDLFYDRSICRNIMVDARYILFVIDKFAGAGHLLGEMKLVHPKAAK